MIYHHETAEKKLEKQWDGYRPSLPICRPELWADFSGYLEERDLSSELARYNGWYPVRYKNRPRILIPCSNEAGVPYFQARAVEEDLEEGELRYASPPVPRDDSIVIVWPESKLRIQGTTVLEGPMDALAAAELDYLGIALMGNQPNNTVIEHVAKFARSFQPVLIVPDADAIEMGPAVLCALAQRGVQQAMIRAPQKKDLAAMSLKERKRFLYA